MAPISVLISHAVTVVHFPSAALQRSHYWIYCHFCFFPPGSDIFPHFHPAFAYWSTATSASSLLDQTPFLTSIQHLLTDLLPLPLLPSWIRHLSSLSSSICLLIYCHFRFFPPGSNTFPHFYPAFAYWSTATSASSLLDQTPFLTFIQHLLSLLFLLRFTSIPTFGLFLPLFSIFL